MIDAQLLRPQGTAHRDVVDTFPRRARYKQQGANGQIVDLGVGTPGQRRSERFGGLVTLGDLNVEPGYMHPTQADRGVQHATPVDAKLNAPGLNVDAIALVAQLRQAGAGDEISLDALYFHIEARCQQRQGPQPQLRKQQKARPQDQQQQEQHTRNPAQDSQNSAPMLMCTRQAPPSRVTGLASSTRNAPTGDR